MRRVGPQESVQCQNSRHNGFDFQYCFDTVSVSISRLEMQRGFMLRRLMLSIEYLQTTAGKPIKEKRRKVNDRLKTVPDIQGKLSGDVRHIALSRT